MVFGGKIQRRSCGCHRNKLQIRVRIDSIKPFKNSFFMIHFFPPTRTRKLSENEALQRTIIFHSLPSITPNLTNVMNATNLRDNLILYLDNQDEYRLSRPPPNFFVDLKNMPIEDWREKYMLARDKMKVPCLLLSLSDVSVLYHVRDECGCMCECMYEQCALFKF